MLRHATTLAVHGEDANGLWPPIADLLVLVGMAVGAAPSPHWPWSSATGWIGTGTVTEVQLSVP